MTRARFGRFYTYFPSYSRVTQYLIYLVKRKEICAKRAMEHLAARYHSVLMKPFRPIMHAATLMRKWQSQQRMEIDALLTRHDVIVSRSRMRISLVPFLHMYGTLISGNHQSRDCAELFVFSSSSSDIILVGPRSCSRNLHNTPPSFLPSFLPRTLTASHRIGVCRCARHNEFSRTNTKVKMR